MRTPTPSVEHTSHIFSPSPLIFTRRASALSLMRLRSTRDCMRSASALKAATRRLSCTTWACSRLRRRATSGAWRMASMCWQVRTPGTGAPAPAAHSQLPCARFVATQRRQLDRHHHHHRRRGHRCLLRRRLLFFRLIDALSRAAVLPRVACGSPFRRRVGGAELQGGDHSGCGGAAAQQLSWGGSGRPLARLRRLWRRSAARQSCAHAGGSLEHEWHH